LDSPQIYEGEGNNEEAMENYNQACDYYVAEGTKSAVTECQLKIATLLTTSRGDADPSTENYARAAEIYQKV
jgi:hypothetical protein